MRLVWGHEQEDFRTFGDCCRNGGLAGPDQRNGNRPFFTDTDPAPDAARHGADIPAGRLARHRQLSGVPGRRPDLHGLGTSAGARDPLGPDLRRRPYCGDGTWPFASALVRASIFFGCSERLRAGWGLGLGDADPRTVQQGPMVRIRLCRGRYRHRLCRSRRPRCGARRLGFALDLDCNGRRCCRACIFPLAAAGHERGSDGGGSVKHGRRAASSCCCRCLLRPVWLRLHHSGDLPSRAGSRIYRRSGGVRLGLADIRDRCRHFHARSRHGSVIS